MKLAAIKYFIRSIYW